MMWSAGQKGSSGNYRFRVEGSGFPGKMCGPRRNLGKKCGPGDTGWGKCEEPALPDRADVRTRVCAGPFKRGPFFKCEHGTQGAHVCPVIVVCHSARMYAACGVIVLDEHWNINRAILVVPTAKLKLGTSVVLLLVKKTHSIVRQQRNISRSR